MSQIGERPVVRLFLRGNRHLEDVLLSTDHGGTRLESGIVERLATREGGGTVIEVRSEPCAGMAAFRRDLEAGDSAATSAKPDIVIVSVEPDLVSPTPADRFREDLEAVVHHVREVIGAHLLVLAASTVDPDEWVSRVDPVGPDPNALAVHRLILATIEVSTSHGISIIDVDRRIAEMGASAHVPSFLEYSAEACDAICTDIISVLDHYGFFDDRPLLPQVARRQT